jgi:hypothetical protein
MGSAVTAWVIGGFWNGLDRVAIGFGWRQAVNAVVTIACGVLLARWANRHVRAERERRRAKVVPHTPRDPARTARRVYSMRSR